MALKLLSSILQKEYDTAFLFVESLLHGKPSPQKTEEKIKSIADFCGEFDYVMFSVMSSYAPLALKISEEIKTRNPHIRVIMGGPYAIARPVACLKYVDYVCIFEGEGVLELLRHLEVCNEPKSIGNFICDAKDLGKKIHAVENLNELPAPDYSNDNEYWVVGSGIVKKRVLPREVLFQTMRGCPYNCSFCFNSIYNQIKLKNNVPILRFKSIKNVIQQLRDVRRHLPQLETIQLITDNNFLSRKLEDLEAFAEQYDKLVGVSLVLEGDFRSPDFHKKILALSKIHSLYAIDFGLQSGSEEFNRRVFNRHQKNKEVITRHRFIRSAFDKSVKISYDIIFAHPEEEKRDILETINLMLKLEGVHYNIIHFIPSATGVPNSPAGENDYSISSTQDYAQLKRFPFYYFMMFLINYLRTYHLGFLLPQKMNVSRFTEFLNRPLFSRLYFGIIRFSIWFGDVKWRKR